MKKGIKSTHEKDIMRTKKSRFEKVKIKFIEIKKYSNWGEITH